MNVWFGTSWGAPLNAYLERVPVPVGATCLWCEEPIAAEDSGWGVHAKGDQWMHVECFTRQIIGSVGHQLGVCACNGGEYEDNPNLTKREAAKAAFEQARSIRETSDHIDRSNLVANLQPYIVCPRCGSVSHHPKDISERYCGKCHRFHNEGQ